MSLPASAELPKKGENFTDKGQRIVRAAARLFASQGFEGTTTLQIAVKAGVTEPLIYYHFRNKDGLFTHILEECFDTYFERLDSLPVHTATQFEKIKHLIECHFDIVAEMPDQIYMAQSACPAKLRDPSGTCARNVEKQRTWLATYLSKCLEKGILSGEFRPLTVEATVDILIALINGTMRRRSLELELAEGIREETVEFCRRSLLA